MSAFPEAPLARVRSHVRSQLWPGMLAGLTIVTLLAATALAPAGAETPTPLVPSPTATDGTPAPVTPAPITPAEPSESSSEPESPAATSTSPESAVEPSARSDAAPEQARLAGDAAAAAAGTAPVTVSLRVTAAGSPQPGTFFEDIGSFVITGSLSNDQVGRGVGIYQKNPGGTWARIANVLTEQGGTFRFVRPVRDSGTVYFRAMGKKVSSPPKDVWSGVVSVPVTDASIVLNTPRRKIDSLKRTDLFGTVVPARAGVTVSLAVKLAGRYRTTTSATTRADGRFVVPFTYGTSRLNTYRVRVTYRAENRSRWEASKSHLITRIRALSPTVSETTAADVAKTYRAGCPTGPSQLQTIAMNYYGMDRRMHRGVMIVRADLTSKAIRSFSRALAKGQPIYSMRNPNDFDGNDPRQMEANNTSGFNCRKVVGNPYRQSPHSYGIAIDVNTVQNPYRDARGKWWPANGKPYIKRTPKKTGMLNQYSTLTRQLGSEGYFWGGRWYPGRDYQHFQYTR